MTILLFQYLAICNKNKFPNSLKICKTGHTDCEQTSECQFSHSDNLPRSICIMIRVQLNIHLAIKPFTHIQYTQNTPIHTWHTYGTHIHTWHTQGTPIDTCTSHTQMHWEIHKSHTYVLGNTQRTHILSWNRVQRIQK